MVQCLAVPAEESLKMGGGMSTDLVLMVVFKGVKDECLEDEGESEERATGRLMLGAGVRVGGWKDQ